MFDRLGFCNMQLDEPAYQALVKANKDGVEAMRMLSINNVAEFTEWYQDAMCEKFSFIGLFTA